MTESRLAKRVLEKDISEMLREYGAAEKRNREPPLSDGELWIACDAQRIGWHHGRSALVPRDGCFFVYKTK
ncbi:hypothetical protein ATW55_09890 [Ferroacidibacillus organovorans]|uniref:Uncharacterized protein n=1 Tax=Ferroacidibacillus organovorans TaxID=1765683 RepID=A0A101XTH0_9BACL|nr:hypothetical protein ATW55_09890 [Ferroacidibacillus organovorans]